MSNNIIVCKFGGTSVGSIEKIKNVANICISKLTDANTRLIVVTSAMGKTTDDLENMMHDINSKTNLRERDLLLSAGEQISIALLASALQEQGYTAQALLGWQAGIKTTAMHTNAKINTINTDRIHNILKDHQVLVVAGFQGIHEESQEITTLGRGGSDTSAVALAAAVKADICEIYTDVNAVHTTDPRIVPNTSQLKTISYDEMLELAAFGAQVLHPRSVEIAREFDLPMRVRSSWELDNTGTLVTGKIKYKNSPKLYNTNTMSNSNEPVIENIHAVRGVALDKSQAYLSLRQVPDTPGIAGKIFAGLAKENISVDLIVQSVSENNTTEINFTVDKDQVDKAKNTVLNITNEITSDNIVCNDKVVKISIVGAGMINQPGIAAKMFEILGQNNINILIISTSEIRISCIIDEQYSQQAMNLIHDAFDLSNLTN